MRVALVQPNTITITGVTTPPLALMFVAATAEAAGHEVRIFDRNIHYNSLRKIVDYKPDALAISAFTGLKINDGIAVSQFAKEAFGKDFPVIWGGIHPSLMPEQTLENPHIDYAVIGEGEITFPELLGQIDGARNFGGIQGIAWKDGNNIVVNERRPFIKDLDTLPFYRWDLVNTKKYFRQGTTVSTSRGCPHKCGFCYNEKYSFRRWRGFTAPRVLEELARLRSITHERYVNFYEDNFTANLKRFYGIMDGLPPEYSLWFESRADKIDEEFISHLKKFKQVWIFVGVESASPRILEKMCKGITQDHIQRAFGLLKKEKNVQTTGSVCLGIPGETAEDTKKTVAMIKKLSPTRYNILPFIPFPGSGLYDECLEQGNFEPPARLDDWGGFVSSFFMVQNFATDDEGIKEVIRKTNRFMHVRTLFNYIVRMQFFKILHKLRDFDWVLIKLLHNRDLRNALKKAASVSPSKPV